MATKRELVEKTDKQFQTIQIQISELQKSLKLMDQKTFRKKQLNLLGLYSLVIILNKIKGILYSSNLFCEEFLLETGKRQIKRNDKRK